MRIEIRFVILLLVIAGFMAVLTPCPNATRVNGMRCDESSGVTLLSRDALFQRMADAVQREEDEKKAREIAAQDALETRLKRHCAVRETNVCAAVARLQRNMLEHPRSDHWWIDGVGVEHGFCAMNAMFRIGFTTSFRLDTGVLRVEKGHVRGHPRSTLLFERHYSNYPEEKWYEEGYTKNHEAISRYFEYLERNALPSPPSPSEPIQLTRDHSTVAMISTGVLLFFTFIIVLSKNIQ